jgi:hypothetical protein
MSVNKLFINILNTTGGEKQLGVVSKYQYLGLLLTEFLHYNEMAKAVARLAGEH